MGPTTKAISVTGGITFEQLRNNYLEQARGLVEGGADLLLLETCQDTRNIKAGVLGDSANSAAKSAQPIPVIDLRDDRAHGHNARGPRASRRCGLRSITWMCSLSA